MQVLLQGWRWVDYLHLLPTDHHGPGEILAKKDITSHINKSTGTPLRNPYHKAEVHSEDWFTYRREEDLIILPRTGRKFSVRAKYEEFSLIQTVNLIPRPY